MKQYRCDEEFTADHFTIIHTVHSIYFTVQGFYYSAMLCTFIRITCLHPLDLKLPKVQSVVITPGFVGTSPNAEPSLNVSWSAVDDPTVSYVVRYSMSQGSLTTPPTDARQVTTANLEVTLSDSLAANKRSSYTYYIWVAATSAGVPMGEYSDRTSGATLNSEQFYSLTMSH